MRPYIRGTSVWVCAPYKRGTRCGGVPFIKRGTSWVGKGTRCGVRLATIERTRFPLASLFKGRWRGSLPRRWVIWGNVPQLRLPCEREDGRTNVYEAAKVGYILNYTTYRGALFKGSWQVGAIATTCLRVSTALFMSIPLYSSRRH